MNLAPCRQGWRREDPLYLTIARRLVQHRGVPARHHVGNLSTTLGANRFIKVAHQLYKNGCSHLWPASLTITL